MSITACQSKPLRFKRIILLFVACLLALPPAYSQTAMGLGDQALVAAREGKLEEALGLFTQSLTLNPEYFSSRYYRGVVREQLMDYEGAVSDYDSAILVRPQDARSHLRRANVRELLTRYEEAMVDYNRAIELDPEFADAYFDRGLLHSLLSNRELSCKDFQRAKDLGIEQAKYKLERCDGKEKGKDIYPILRLTKAAGNRKYGFDDKHPVKVGSGPEGGPANQRAYLRLLRDPQGKPVKFERKGSCCSYKSKNGLIGGMALVDRYEIIYRDEKGEEKTEIVYISMYDYEEPMILHGFKTVGQ